MSTDGTANYSRDWTPDPLTTYEQLCGGNDPFKTVILRRATTNRDKLCTDFVKEMLQQKIASLHFAAWHKAFYFVAMIITVISAVVSITSTSKFESVGVTHTTALGLTVAVLQILLSVVQSYSNQQDYGAKAAGHRNAAATLKKLYQGMKHSMWENRKTTYRNAISEDDDLSDGFDIGKKGVPVPAPPKKDAEKKGEDAEKKGEDAAKPEEKKAAAGEPEAEEKPKTEKKKDKQSAPTSYSEKYNQAIEQVDSMVPIQVANAFNLLEARIRVVNESMFTNKGNSLVAWEHVLEAMFFQLTENIVDTKGFPYYFPTPEWAVEKTLKEFKESIDAEKEGEENSADLLRTIMNRSKTITDTEKTTVKVMEPIPEVSSGSTTASSIAEPVAGDHQV